MDTYAAELELLVDLEQRHDDLLVHLDELDKRVEDVLNQWQGGREEPLHAAKSPVGQN